MSLRWLHVSDLHAGGPGAAVRNALMDALASDIKTMAREVGPPELILFTGDLAYGGQADEYAEVDHVLERIRGCLAEIHPGAPAPLLFAVPGNHDLARPQKRRYLRECAVLDKYDDGDDHLVRDLRQELWEEQDPALIAPMFAAFMSWHKQRVIVPLEHARDRGDRCRQVHASFFPGDLSAIVDSQGLRVALVGLNSSWLQSSGAIGADGGGAQRVAGGIIALCRHRGARRSQSQQGVFFALRRAPSRRRADRQVDYAVVCCSGSSESADAQAARGAWRSAGARARAQTDGGAQAETRREHDGSEEHADAAYATVLGGGARGPNPGATGGLFPSLPRDFARVMGG